VKFSDILDQARALLQRKGRISYRALKMGFELDDEQLDVLKEELIDIQELAVDKDGKMLVWSGDGVDPPASIPQAQPPARPAVQPTAPEGERRQLTVMFCDLVGSTALSAQLDPEDLHAIVRAYQDACRQVIERYEGHIAQYLGDGILVYFGYPAAHEDDAIRAVRSGLEILDVLSTLPLSQPIQARIGLHTGPVVIGTVGSGEHTEQLALGETPNIAARVQGKAALHTIAISADTYRLVQGHFACYDLGPQDLKGLSSALTLYQVTGEGEAHSRFDVSVQQGLTPLIGREEEVQLLVRRWERAKAGNGQVVLLSGEAGIGKSRLEQVLRDNIQAEPQLSILCQCSPFYQNSALYPIIDRLQQVLAFTKDDTAAAKFAKLSQWLEPEGTTDDETVALFASFLLIPSPDNHPPLQYSPQKQKERTLQALVTWLQNASERQPVRIEFEDLHWADPSTLELLGLLIDQAPTARMLLLLTFRPEFTPPWPAQAHILQMYLNRLPQQDIAAMVERVAGKALPDEVVQQLLTKSDGVPLYIEEMTKNLLESGLLTETDGQYVLTGPLPEMAIPSSLQDSFVARLDRLAPVRELAQIGAVLGREFTYELILAVSQMDDVLLRDGLGQLVNAEILFARGVPPEATYTFKHALLQDVAYESQLKSRRHQLHAQTAQVLEEQYAETVETRPELLAHHYTEAGLAERAIPYWQLAGQRANQRAANVEAITYLSKGIELVQTLPDTPERAQQELPLQTALGGSLITHKGFAAPEVGALYMRARELCRQVGETPQIFPVLWGLCAFYSVRAEWQTAQKLAEQLLSLARRAQDNAHLIEAHYAMGQTWYFEGELSQGRKHFEQLLTLYDPAQHHALAFVYGLDPGVMGKSLLASILVLHGYPDQARKLSHEALTLAREVAHPSSLAFCLYQVCWTHYLCRDIRAAQGRAETLMTLSTEQGYANYLRGGQMLRGYALAAQGHRAEGVAQIQPGLDALQAAGSAINRPHFLCLLAEIHGQDEHRQEGLKLQEEAQALVEKTGGICTSPRSIGCGASCCFTLCRHPSQRSKPYFRRPSPWPGAKRRNYLNSAPAPAWPACGNRRGRPPKPETCSPQSKIGSPKVLIPRI